MNCSEAAKQEALERVVEYVVRVEARTLLRWRGQVTQCGISGRFVLRYQAATLAICGR
eukprot:SAG11_NODE_3254_length_2576_cov_6.225676_2_plen_58_part_00